ncbi:MAG: hypothetical protein ACI9GO_000389 [Bacteroidia bacterium]
MFRHITVYLIVSFLGYTADAQSWEFGGMLGGSNYHGDLAYNIVPKETNLSGGVFFKYNINETWSIRPTLSYMKISGADDNFKENTLRNLSFRNNIYELSTIMEYNFRPFSNKSIHQRSTFYLLGGIAVFLHKPQAKLDNKWHDLPPLMTENQRYSLVQVSLPMGAGIKHAVTSNFIIGIEAGWRMTFTDYIDDVSTVYPAALGQEAARFSDRSWEVSENNRSMSNPGDTRGNPDLRDWYFQTALSISYRFTPIKCPF